MKQYFDTSQSEKEDKQTMTAYIKTLITIGLDLRESLPWLKVSRYVEWITR